MLGMILFELEFNSIEEEQRNNQFSRIDELFIEIDINLCHKEAYKEVDEYQNIILKKISQENTDLWRFAIDDIKCGFSQRKPGYGMKDQFNNTFKNL